MVIDKSIVKLICELEYKIGYQTYNPNSYNGWTGEEGCSFKYPVKYCKNKEDLEGHKLTKTKAPIENIAPECIRTMKYTFGSNHLYIGDGIVAALEYLEDTYGIDFNKLEEKRTEKRKNALTIIEKQLEDGKNVKISSGTNIVGIDLPIGRFAIKKPNDEFSSHIIIDIDDENGESIKHIFSFDDEVIVEFKEGYIVNSYFNYILEAKNE